MSESVPGRESSSTEEEIEITPDMMSAGVVELARFDPREDDFEVAIYLIFEAIIKASRGLCGREILGRVCKGVALGRA